MRTHYRQIIIGATFYGCGLAAASPEDTLIVEPSILLGGDFTLNFNPGRSWDYSPSHPWAREFQQDLERRNALVEGRIHQPALCPVFSQWCLDHHLDIALSTRVLERNDDEIVIFDVEGRHRLRAEQIVDATPKIGESKRLTASLVTDGEDAAGSYERFEIVAGRFASEAFLLMPLPAETMWSEARLALFDAWQGRPAVLATCDIAAVAVRFDYDNYANPVVALDHGLNGGM